MWETSKAPQSLRTARCSGMTPSYCTGISQPANGTIRAPSATCCSWRGVRRSVCTARMLMKVPKRPPTTGRGRRADWELGVAEERGHVKNLVRDLEGLGTARSCRRTRRHALPDRGALARPAHRAEARRDHGHAHLVGHRVVDDGPEDDVGI